jgi:hypothetical protein
VIGVWRSAALEHPMSAVEHSPSIYLHDVADPGNLGTVLRAAQAFDAGAVVLSPLTADRFGPKAVRASMGAIFGQPERPEVCRRLRPSPSMCGGDRDEAMRYLAELDAATRPR